MSEDNPNTPVEAIEGVTESPEVIKARVIIEKLEKISLTDDEANSAQQNPFDYRMYQVLDEHPGYVLDSQLVQLKKDQRIANPGYMSRGIERGYLQNMITLDTLVNFAGINPEDFDGIDAIMKGAKISKESLRKSLTYSNEAIKYLPDDNVFAQVYKQIVLEGNPDPKDRKSSKTSSS